MTTARASAAGNNKEAGLRSRTDDRKISARGLVRRRGGIVLAALAIAVLQNSTTAQSEPRLDLVSLGSSFTIAVPKGSQIQRGGDHALSIRAQLVPSHWFTVFVDNYPSVSPNLFVLYANYQTPAVDGITVSEKTSKLPRGVTVVARHLSEGTVFRRTQALAWRAARAFVIEIDTPLVVLSPAETAAAAAAIDVVLKSIKIN
jgi:hypothetical protein